MKRLYLTVFVSLLSVVSCSKEGESVQPVLFGEKTLQCQEGSFLVLFNGDGVWSVSSDEDWIHVVNRQYKDEAAFEVRYDSNESTIGDHRFCRKGSVNVISKDGNWKNVMVIRQEGLAPFLSIDSVTVPQQAGTYSLKLESNLTDRERNAIAFTSDAAWISGITLGRDGTSIMIDVTSGSNREGNVIMTFTDAWGRKYSASAAVNQ